MLWFTKKKKKVEAQELNYDNIYKFPNTKKKEIKNVIISIFIIYYLYWDFESEIVIFLR